MPRIAFTRDFPWHVPGRGGRITIHYPAGTTELVSRACADAAEASVCGKRVDREEKPDADNVRTAS
ncbi:hypothetical protein SAMN05216548_1049 [Faunimonas pinastri]|uniref:Uncharacterized protein n=1 Tax=Faunimonas pinastri TaxID=1855383 RepID=A0A1H9F5I0_9HYPH|nr:hypothetical protein [Faunimonas pinastri]SEQ33182.1 hypothetical protein SAMN05216548_1049 [Faunimonas pinastri]